MTAPVVKLGKLGVLLVKYTLQEELGGGWQGCRSAGDDFTSGPAACFSLLRVLVRCSSPCAPLFGLENLWEHDVFAEFQHCCCDLRGP